MKIIQTNNNKYYQTPSTKSNINAFNTGTVVQCAVTAPLAIMISDKMVDKMWKINNSVNSKDLYKGISKAFKDSHLEDKNLRLALYNPRKELSFDETVTRYIKDVLKTQTPKEIFKNRKQLFNNLIVNLIEQGYNAGFDNEANIIHINPKKMGTSFFHELGHAINHNANGFWKMMQKVRNPLMIVSGVIPFVAMAKRKKAEGEEPKNIIDKSTTFVKDNVGKLTFISMVPVIAEELKASHNGNKIAKQILNPKLYQKVVNTNRIGAFSYIGTSALMGLGAYLGNLVRDKIAHPKEVQI